MITEIAFVVYPVTEVARARRFYEGLLGLKVESSFQGQWIEYGIAGGTFAIAGMDESHKPGLKGAVIAFEVVDLDALVSKLKQQGVPITMDPAETPVCRFAKITDPDGNEIILHKRNA